MRLSRPSDRKEFRDHYKSGFIDLGPAPAPLPGFPELVINHYLYGLGEIVGWQYCVQPGKSPKYRRRTEKDTAALSTTLPAWERLRIYLQGSMPQVSLYAIPQLTHIIHTRLAERRRSASDAPPPLDELLLLLDSKWNGFVFDLPEMKARVAFVQPVHSLYVDGHAFVYQFSRGRALAGLGDIPFVSVQTFQQYAKVFLDERLDVGDVVASTERAKSVHSRFATDTSYLGSYKALIDIFVRALLVPDSRLPAYLAAFDYPEGKIPSAREIDYDFDMPRRHAILLWAYVGKDPFALADFLDEHLFSQEANRFPADVALPVQLTLLVREMDGEITRRVAERVTNERAGSDESLYEREFSPYATYRSVDGTPASAYTAHSFHAFNQPCGDVIRTAARAALLDALAE